MEAFGGHASRPASLGVASRGNELLSPVRQTGQPTQQTTVPAAQQHSPAHAVPVVVQAVSQGGLHAYETETETGASVDRIGIGHNRLPFRPNDPLLR